MTGHHTQALTAKMYHIQFACCGGANRKSRSEAGLKAVSRAGWVHNTPKAVQKVLRIINVKGPMLKTMFINKQACTKRI